LDSSTATIPRAIQARDRRDGRGGADSALQGHWRPRPRLGVRLRRGKRGFLGARRDRDAGLIDLNARGRDPVLARFVTPDDGAIRLARQPRRLAPGPDRTLLQQLDELAPARHPL